MNPFTDAKLTASLFTRLEAVNGSAAADVARIISATLRDPFTRYVNRKSSDALADLDSQEQLGRVVDEVGRVFLLSASRDVTLGMGDYGGKFTARSLSAAEVDVTCLYREPMISLAADWFPSVAERVDADWGIVNTAPASKALRGQFGRAETPESRGLPPGIPRLPSIDGLASELHPLRVGWINYWSPATCELLQFPDPVRDADLLSRSRRLTTGGWVAQITDEPLDPGRPEHLRALVKAYARFPAIGQR